MIKYICALFCIFIWASCVRAQNTTLLTSLSLKDAIDLAIKNRPELKKEKYNIDAAQGRYLREISLPQPALSISNEFIPNGSGISNFDERSIEISQSFDFPISYFAKGAKATAEINAANSGFKQTTNMVTATVKRAYYAASAKQRLLKIAEENLNITNDFFNKAEIRFKVGDGSNLELLTAKVQLTTAKSYLELVHKDYQEALNELNYSLGYDKIIDFQNIKFLDSLAFKKYNFSLEDLLNRSMEVNPLLKKAVYELESSEINKQIALMGFFPSFNVSYLFQTRSDNSNYYGIKLGFSLPLWFMLDQKGKIQESEANYQSGIYELQYVKNMNIRKISSAFWEYQNNVKQLLLYQNELIPQAEEILNTAGLSYQAGEITYLEFLQAKITTINARINLIKSLFDFEESIINLEESTSLLLE